MQLVKDSITEQIYRIIKDKILLNEMRLGQQINPRALSEEYRVSVMPVRDALLKLANEGLVVNKSRVGFFVRSFTFEEIRDIMEVRSLYELYCLEKHFENIDKKKVKNYFNRCIETPELSRRDFDELDEQIHDLLINAARNTYLIKSYQEVRNQIIIFKHLDKDQMEVAHQEHIGILKAILEKNKPKAVRLLRMHIERVAKAIA